MHLMTVKIKSLIFAVLLIYLFQLPIFKAYAINEEFLIDLNVVYKYNEEGFIEVSKTFNIINQKADLTITNFSQTLEDFNFYDFKAFDTQGETAFKEEDNDNIKKISIPIRNSRIGVGQVNTARFTYKSKDLVSKNGNILIINLPKISDSNIRKASVTLEVPNTVGKEILVSPNPDSIFEEDGKVFYKFDEKSGLKYAISATFGEYQVVNFDIKYDLQNDSNWFQVQEVALIPDIPTRQEVMIDKLEPRPFEIYVDEDGNYLAKYRLFPKEKINISYRGTIRTYGRQIDIKEGGSFEEILPELQKYTLEKKFWETFHPDIKDIANALNDPEKNVASNAYNIYTYLVENYDYNFEINKNPTTQRNGAQKALNREAPMGCMEFTDSFIAIARAMGIPAREINGYAFSKDPEKNPISIDINGGDILHSWAEFYDPKLGWVPVDPTWGSTSGIDYFSNLDLNHLTFVVKGIDSSYPLPAGFYKSESSSKSLQFDFPDNPDDIYFDKAYLAEKVFTFNISNIISGLEPVKITNSGKTSLLNLQGQNLPPFQERIIYHNKGDTPTFEDFSGNKYAVVIKNPISYYLLIIIYTVFLGLLLYVMTIVLINHSKSLQRFFRRLYFRPRGRGR